MRSLAFLWLLPVFISCKTQTKDILETREIPLNGLTKDSVIIFLTAENDTFGIYREIDILENENTDTLVLGYGVIAPGQLGKVWFIQTNLDPSAAAYLEPALGLPRSKPWSYAQLSANPPKWTNE
ncbi:MAG TPA: hypothetical protein VD993_05885 [Chitinophagaceae bacterium]|nr:hypothetical protein [Chitinophagaceae bacterium]